MKKFLLLLFFIFCTNSVFASVSEVKWGVDGSRNLRFVFDLTEPADFDLSIENNNLTVTVQTPFEGEERSEKIKSDFADEMYIQAAGTKTILRVPFNRPVAKENLKTFTLKQDPVTKRPSRIVIDVLNRLPATVQTKNVAPKVTVGSLPSPVKRPPPVAAPQETTVVASTPVVSNSSNKIAQIPEIRRASVPTSKSSTPVVGSQPVRATEPQQPAQKVTVSTPAQASSAQETNKVVVGSSPTNKSEAQAKATQRGKEAVADILSKISSGIGSVVKKDNSQKTGDVKQSVSTEVAKVVNKVVEKTKLPDSVKTKATETVNKTVAKVTEKIPPIQVGSAGKQEKKSTPVVKSETKKETKKGEYHTKGGIKGKIITIDPGHGGSDPGAVSNKGTYEKTITLSMAKKLKSDLEKMGAIVYLTRNTDTDVSQPYADDEVELQARVDIAEQRGSDLFISLHINASVNKKASGISTYYYPKTGYDTKLAGCIHKQLTSNFGLTDMGVREANFYVTKRCSMPAVLMELGFITNSKEEKTISGNWFQDKAMGLVAKGIQDYFK